MKQDFKKMGGMEKNVDTTSYSCQYVECGLTERGSEIESKITSKSKWQKQNKLGGICNE